MSLFFQGTIALYSLAYIGLTGCTNSLDHGDFSREQTSVHADHLQEIAAVSHENTGGGVPDRELEEFVALTTVRGAERPIAVANGLGHTCALLAGGEVKCWGYDWHGQLGNGTTGYAFPMPQRVVGLNDAVAVTAGWNHTCAIRVNGTVACWGLNEFGQLGNGITSSSSIPVAVSGLTGVKGISGGDGHTCAVRMDGSVACWGRNTTGDLGNGTTTDSAIPVPVLELGLGIDSIVAGSGHTCAVRRDATVACWGANAWGQTGHETGSDATPATLAGLFGIKTVAAGNHTCALFAGGTVACWGCNDYGQLGNATTPYTSTPMIVRGTRPTSSVTAGLGHTCALLMDRTVQCWGLNDSGQLGNSTTANSSIPVGVYGLRDVKNLSTGMAWAHTCALRWDGSIWCWGDDRYGQLGDRGSTAHSTPVKVLF